MKSKLIDIEVQKIYETDDAYLLWDGVKRDHYNGKVGAWIPKRICENNNDGTFTMPEDWAIEKGLV